MPRKKLWLESDKLSSEKAPVFADNSARRSADHRPAVMVQVYMPATLRGQLRELAHELSDDKRVTLSDVVRAACRAYIKEHLQGG